MEYTNPLFYLSTDFVFARLSICGGKLKIYNLFCPSRSKMAIQEVGQFQNRLNRNMGECQEKARDLMTPGFENDARKTAKVENALINCMAKTVDEHIALLNPMKDRIISSFKQFK